jgi:hypothetical protein
VYVFKGDPGFEDESHLSAQELDRYVAQMAAADSLTCVGHNSGAAFLRESGSTQGDMPFKAMLEAAPRPKVWHVYRAVTRPTPHRRSTCAPGSREAVS